MEYSIQASSPTIDKRLTDVVNTIISESSCESVNDSPKEMPNLEPIN